MTERKHFLDSNVVLYLLSGDASSATTAEALLARGPVISVQVLNEVTNVCRKKLSMSWSEIHQFLELVRSFCSVMPLTVDVHDQARQLAERCGLAFYDSVIVAAALLGRCTTLYSEDMHDGLVVTGSLTIVNPFRT